MTITPKQVANLIFSTSQLRYFEKELAADPRAFELLDIATKWQFKVDEVLSEMGVDGFISRQELIEIIKINHNEKIETVL